MDWNSEEGRALLWKAYPDGYLAKRGVLTVGGWQCVEGEEGEDEATYGWWRPIPDNDGLTELGLLRDLPDARVNAGALLPLPDPADTATWACLLRDLAEAVNFRNRSRGALGVSGTHALISAEYGGVYLRSDAPYCWTLYDSNRCGWQWMCQCRSPETVVTSHGSYPSWRPDLAEALVTLRAYEREYEAAALRPSGGEGGHRVEQICGEGQREPKYR